MNRYTPSPFRHIYRIVYMTPAGATLHWHELTRETFREAWSLYAGGVPLHSEPGCRVWKVQPGVCLALQVFVPDLRYGLHS